MKFQAVLDEHRRRLSRVVDQRGARAVKRLYDEAAADLLRQIKQIAPGRQDSFDAHHKRMVLAQLRQGGALLARRLYGDLGDLSREAQVEAVRGLDEVIVKLEREYSGLTPVLPTADAVRFAEIVDAKRTSSLLRQFPEGTENRIRRQEEKRVTERMPMRRRHAEAVGNLAARVIDDCEKQMAVSTLLNEPSAQTIDRIESVIHSKWSDAERIVRTESAWAAQGSARDAIEAAAEVLPQLRARWCEHVDEATLTPLDNRVAVDSIAMHGQVAPPGGLFTMPATAPRGTLDDPSNVQVPVKLVGRQWEHPPDRPLDRSVCAPWRKEWGLTGWQFEAGRRIQLI